jgi:hypothetical protein
VQNHGTKVFETDQEKNAFEAQMPMKHHGQVIYLLHLLCVHVFCFLFLIKTSIYMGRSGWSVNKASHNSDCSPNMSNPLGPQLCQDGLGVS